MTASLTLLVRKRKECGVDDDNALCNSPLLRGQDCLRKNARACGAVNPCSLTSTNLRKHIATISRVMNLKDNELDQLANFLGHDIRVHREYYRLPQSTIQLAKISKLLIAMQGGSVKDIQGKSLDQIGDDIEDFGPTPNHPGPPPETGIQGIVIVNFHAYNCAARPLRKNS
ncbi:hypothetical protein N1851_024278 [Merluccius polli]|uniref:Uncharacterized protein n=1 Tax=Merluccius polli TaxID=89951 RepID=A0AA47MFJ0_MERPO|nr:hypothetical protein N1851_024278 [Merluccius polli]